MPMACEPRKRRPRDEPQPYSRKQLFLIAWLLFAIVAITATLVWLSV